MHFILYSQVQQLWPSDFWRYAGVALNALGVAGALLGLSTYISNRK